MRDVLCHTCHTRLIHNIRRFNTKRLSTPASSPSCPARHTTAAQHQRCQQHQQHQRRHASKQRKHSNAPQPARNASVAPMAHTHQSPCSLNAQPASEAIGSNCTSESRTSIRSSPVSQPSSLTRELSMPACYSCQRPVLVLILSLLCGS